MFANTDASSFSLNMDKQVKNTNITAVTQQQCVLGTKISAPLPSPPRSRHELDCSYTLTFIFIKHK